MTTLIEPSGTRAANVRVSVASGDALDVRRFAVVERMSSLFSVTLTAASENADIDLDAVAGLPASLQISGGSADTALSRVWTGVCCRLQQIAAEERGVSTYELTIVPSLWLSTQKRNYRIFQNMSEVDIALRLLGEWGVEPDKRLTGTYKRRKYRVQYGESDFAFLSRMLEDAGVSFYFAEDGGQSRMVLSDAPHANEPRALTIPFHDDASTLRDRDYVTRVRVAREVRPGRYTMRDHDYRRDPSYKLASTAELRAGTVEDGLESYHYVPGAFLFESDKGESSPNADDRGKHRTDEGEAAALVKKRLDAKRGAAKACFFETSALDLAPGVVIRMSGHPRSDLGEDKKQLIIGSTLEGATHGEWTHRCEARGAEIAYRPPLDTPKPKVSGVESATVVGASGDEIHTDEFGRVRVHFHWDRESAMDDKSSCWIHVSQPWGGSGFGGMNLPRVGQEVIVDFLGGDPDRPIIIGRVYTNLQKVPFSLPANKTQSGWKSNSTGGGGGYNEIMFEDAAGKELVRMQAQKDMNSLVKNNESANVGNDRSRTIGNNDSVSVGNNRSSMVGSNNSEIVGGNESVAVGGNQGVTVGGNQRVAVSGGQSIEVTGDQAIQVAGNQTEGVQGNREVSVNGTDKLGVTGAQDVAVTGAQKTTLSATHTLNVSSNQDVTVGASQTIHVGAKQELHAGAMQELSAPIQSFNAGVIQSLTSPITNIHAKAQVGVSAPMVQVTGAAIVTVNGPVVSITGASRVVVDAPTVEVTSSGTVTVNGGTTNVKGGTITVDSPGTTTVKGSVVKLNC